MIGLCAFADEISPDLDVQIAVLQDEGIASIELRSAWNINVLDLDEDQLDTVQHALAMAGVAVACIGSPIGKVSIDQADGEIERLDRAIRVANRLGTRLIRVFSFYPSSETRDDFAERVLDAMGALVERAGRAGITLVHENEKEIFGDTAARCRTLLETFGGAGMTAAFDPANFIQCGQRPYPDAYDALRPWIGHVHVKDALPDGNVTAAGEGAAGWPRILERLREDGYDGYLSLEPHLAAQGQLGGFSGPDRFRYASRALQALLKDMNWPYA